MQMAKKCSYTEQTELGLRDKYMYCIAATLRCSAAHTDPSRRFFPHAHHASLSTKNPRLSKVLGEARHHILHLRLELLAQRAFFVNLL